MLVDGFAWQVQRDITLNFIGLFDTVAGIVSPLVGDFKPGDARVSGLNLALPEGVANKIVQFVARDEHRLNFSLTRTDNDIVLPGAHSDIGGGYLPRAREKILISKPLSSLERLETPDEKSSALSRSREDSDPWHLRLKEYGFDLKTEIWSVNQPFTRHDVYEEKRVYVATRLDREVDGDLSKIYLSAMREWGLRHHVPFKEIPVDPTLNLPEELLTISEKLQAYALGDSQDFDLGKEEEALLFRKYIHFSANWNPVKNLRNSALNGVFINRPANDYERIYHANK
jgi:type VI secretion system secreted protein VgrG